MEITELKYKSIFERFCENQGKFEGKPSSLLDSRDDVSTIFIITYYLLPS